MMFVTKKLTKIVFLPVLCNKNDLMNASVKFVNKKEKIWRFCQMFSIKNDQN